MAEKINLRSSKVKEQKRRVADYGTETPLSSTAVERGSTRWLSGSTVVIEGLLDVTGLTTISGTLNVSGTTTLSGSTTIAGPTGITGALTIAGATSITGQLDVTGPTTLAGTLDITGDTTLRGDMTVTDGGLIKVGANMTLTPVAGGGSVQFANGSSLSSSGTAIGLAGGGSTLDVSSAGVQVGTGQGAIMDLMANNTWAIAGGGGSLMANGGGILDISFTQTKVNGNFSVSGTSKVTGNSEALGRFRVGNPYATGNAPNVYMDANGWLYRTSWAPPVP